MISFKRYLSYHAKSRIGYVVTTGLLGFLITFITLLDEHNGEVTIRTDSLFYMPAVVIAIAAALSAILEFSPFLNRRNLDTLYSLPIDRRQMYLAHYLTGFISTVIAHAASFWLVFFFWLPHREYFSLGYAIPLYFISLVCGFIMYATAVFLFTQGNTVADSCLTLGLGSFALPVLLGGIEELFDLSAKIGHFYYESAFYWSPINHFTTAYQSMIEQDTFLILPNFFATTETVAIIILFLAIGIASTVAFFLTYHKKRVETVGEISTSWFSYRTMIPLFGFSLFTLLRIDVFWIAIIFACMVVGYVIYRRTYRLKFSDLIVLGTFVLYGVVGIMI